MADSIGLMMIVKNEALTLPRLAASLAGQIDFWTIVDTGSTDATREVAPRVFADVPGHLAEVAWDGFAAARNAALREARPHTDWLLYLDADETVVGDVRGALGDGHAQCIEAQQDFGDLSYWLPRLLSSVADWQWRGRTHEYLSLDGGDPRTTRTDSFRVYHHADGGSRGDKFERDVALLEADLHDDPDNPRTAFYLARTHEDSGRSTQAAEWYRKRIALGGWEEERWYARWRLGACLLTTDRSAEAAGVLLDAWAERPWRVEPLWTLAEHYRTTESWKLCWEIGNLARRHTAARPDGSGELPANDRLFVHESAYEWRMAYERSIAAYYVGDRSTGRRLCEYLTTRELPDSIRASVESNMAFYRDNHRD
jgi:tetratricopeptide (TPR) repeat protein